MQTNSVGIDICKISRIKLKEKFLKKILHKEEYVFFKQLVSKKRKKEFVAGRWSAKEAIYKALNFNISFNEILIKSDGKKPRVIFPENLSKFNISISHDEKYAISIAILNNL